MVAKKENTRLEAFCDGVFAIAITLLILELKIPPVTSVHSVHEFWIRLWEDWPSWFGFVLSFCLILIAWVNHHYIFTLLNKTSPLFIYANGFMLFTVVIFPYLTGLMAEYFQTSFAQPAITLYCFANLLHNIAWNVLAKVILSPIPLTKDAASLDKAIFGLKNVRLGFLIYLFIFILSFWFPKTSMCIITASWILWILVGIQVIPAKKKK
jgi:uncharacterized membrane protein